MIKFAQTRTLAHNLCLDISAQNAIAIYCIIKTPIAI